MQVTEEQYQQLMKTNDLSGMSNPECITKISFLVDASLDFERREGLEHAFVLIESVEKRQLSSSEKVYVFYIKSNIHANFQHLRRLSDETTSWEFNDKDIEEQIINLRKSLLERDFNQTPDVLKCSILTNLANAFDLVGRFSEAIELWKRALLIINNFDMALGNIGHCLMKYSEVIYDEGHQLAFARHAYKFLDSLDTTKLHNSAKLGFDGYKNRLLGIYNKEFLEKEIEYKEFKLGSTNEELNYRKWCLDNELFLNPLNDIVNSSIAGRDVLTLPNMITHIDQGPIYYGFYNQIKQEYISARFLFYESLYLKSKHYSDNDTFLYDTLDYPAYSLAIEKTKISFRMAYSIFDKTANYLVSYMSIKCNDNSRLSFKNIWYNEQKFKSGLLKDFEFKTNWPLRGLFWLSKDLYKDQDKDGSDFRMSLEPEAQSLAKIRNYLEHNYLKIHNEGSGVSNSYISNDGMCDTLAYSLNRFDFVDKTMKILKLARSVLLYLSCTISVEERIRRQKLKDHMILPVELTLYEGDYTH